MKRIGLLLALSMALVACGSGGPLPLNKNIIEGKTVRFKFHKKQPFETLTMGAYISAYASGTGNEKTTTADRARKAVDPALQRAINSYDPADAIARDVKNYFLKELHMKEAGANAAFEVIIGKSWGIKHHPIALTQYNVYYSPLIEITEFHPADGRDGSKYSNHVYCDFKTDSKYSYDELFKNNAAAIRDALQEAGSACITQFREKLDAKFGH